jgi:ribosomal protein L40E
MEMLIIGLIAIAAFAAVLFPLFRRRPGFGDETEFENIPPATPEQPARDSAPPAGPQGAGAARTDDAVEAEVLRYREAVRAGTVCRKCGQANPVDSEYCYECGARLPLADAKEFE